MDIKMLLSLDSKTYLHKCPWV